MRKRQKNDPGKYKEGRRFRGKVRHVILYALILCCWWAGSDIVYGLDVSGAESFDTGGFDMDVGEGTGQLPENWEDPVSRESEKEQENLESDSVNFGGENQGGAAPDYSVSDSVTEEPGGTEGGSDGASWVENDRQDTGTWEEQSEEVYSFGNEDSTVEDNGDQSDATGINIFQESNTESGELTGIPDSTRIENTEIIPTATATSAPVQSPTVNPKPPQTSAPRSTATPKPAKTAKAKKNENSSKEISTGGLFYYRKEKTEDSPEKAETQKEIIPSFLGEVYNNEIQLEIKEDVSFQILSFRIQGKEIDFHWQGKKLLAEVPRGSGKIEKVELLGFVKSGRLYYEIVDLTEKQ